MRLSLLFLTDVCSKGTGVYIASLWVVVVNPGRNLHITLLNVVFEIIPGPSIGGTQIG